MELLLAGQVANLAAPNAAAAELYVLSEGYGVPVGSDTPLLVETIDWAPAGPTGWTLGRRLIVPITFRGNCAVKVTPIADYQRELDPTTQTFSALTETVDELECRLFERLRYLRARIEVVVRDGLVEIAVPRLIHRPILVNHPVAV